MKENFAAKARAISDKIAEAHAHSHEHDQTPGGDTASPRDVHVTDRTPAGPITIPPRNLQKPTVQPLNADSDEETSFNEGKAKQICKQVSK